ncbi:hypothetical protein FRB95_009897, partial [Tulasnella sp. JGI-2019a]
KFPVFRRSGRILEVPAEPPHSEVEVIVNVEMHNTIVIPASQPGRVVRRSGVSRLGCWSIVPANDENVAVDNAPIDVDDIAQVDEDAAPNNAPIDVDDIAQADDTRPNTPDAIDAVPSPDVPAQHDTIVQRRTSARRKAGSSKEGPQINHTVLDVTQTPDAGSSKQGSKVNDSLPDATQTAGAGSSKRGAKVNNSLPDAAQTVSKKRTSPRRKPESSKQDAPDTVFQRRTSPRRKPEGSK